MIENKSLPAKAAQFAREVLVAPEQTLTLAFAEARDSTTNDKTATPSLPKPETSNQIQINGVEPVVYSLALASPYLGPAKRGPHILEDHDEFTKATEYLKELFLDRNFSKLRSGKYGIVLGDEYGIAYKLYRSALHYSKYEREAGALKLISDAGLAPKLHLFVDAAEEYRLDIKAFDYTKTGFENVRIPRQNSRNALPVLIMDSVETVPLKEADPIKLADGFCKMAELFINENIISWDAEIMINKRTGDVIMIDVGELSQISFNESTESPEAKKQHDKKILHNLLLDFNLSTIEHRIISTYERSGLQAVHSLIASLE